VDEFRDVLALSPEEKREYLLKRPPESRQRLAAKIREYEAMRPDDRELRLRATELRYYLLPLMRQTASQRAEALALIPPDTRPLVEARLREWDRLPEKARADLLANEATMAYFSELEARSEPPGRLREVLSPARRAQLEAGTARWQQLPEAQRRDMLARFRQFFELTTPEKTRALATLSDAERRQIERALQVFGNMSSGQRAQCIRSFEKFTNLSPEERQHFLKHAERWTLLSPDQRQAWRELVAALNAAPPLPPEGVELPPHPTPLRTLSNSRSNTAKAP
jgi:hypothetical protein